MSRKPDVMNAITVLNPSAKVFVGWDKNDTVETCTIKWLEGTAEISREDIQTKLTELQVEHDALDYARKRKAAYPDIYDYMDGIVKNDQTQIDKYIADCQAVKNKYSKGA